MDRQARLALEATVSDLRQISLKLQALAPESKGQLRDDLTAMQQQSETAISYYMSILARHPRLAAPSIAQRVAQAAFGASGVGLIPPHITEPQH